MGKEYLEKAELYETISELEDLARQRVLDTPSNSPAYPRYLAQLQERTNLKHKIYDMPAADVAPMRHGVWEPIIDDFGCLEGWIHPECGRTTKEASQYCPTCGAKMDKED